MQAIRGTTEVKARYSVFFTVNINTHGTSDVNKEGLDLHGQKQRQGLDLPAVFS